VKTEIKKKVIFAPSLQQDSTQKQDLQVSFASAAASVYVYLTQILAEDMEAP
jgi:hypothetical protein